MGCDVDWLYKPFKLCLQHLGEDEFLQNSQSFLNQTKFHEAAGFNLVTLILIQDFK